MIVRDILSAVRRRWWVLLGCVVIGLAAAGASAALSSNTYSSVSRLLVATPNIDTGAYLPPGNLTPQEAAANFATLATGTKIPQKVIDQLHLTYTIPELQLKTHVSVIGTSVIQITVDDPAAATAQQIAQAYANDLVDDAPAVVAQSGQSSSKVSITITDPANLPAVPVPTSGPTATIGLGLLAGLVVGAALIWLLELLDNRIRRPEKLRDAADTSVLGTIADRSTAGSPTLVTDPHSAAAEGYRVVRTALQFVDVTSATPVFVVSGATAGVGTPAVSANLAATFAQAGHRTLLIEADLHQPAVSALLGLPAGHPGLAEVLAGAASASDAVQRWDAGGTDVIAAGTASATPTELVQSAAMDSLLATLRDQYQVIVVDAPALATATDGALLATAGDGAVIVARYNSTTTEQVKRAVQRLGMVRAHVLGAVLVGAQDSGTQLPAPAADRSAPQWSVEA